MRGPAFLVLRAAMAIVLMLGYYVLALAIVAGLVVAPVKAYRFSEHVGMRLALFSLVGVIVILKSFVPRRDRFEAPGPRLTPEQQPRLFRELRRVAAAVGQALPAEVYLIPEMNAWVSHRGGLMGLGSRRVMGLGLPMLQVLSVRELRAAIAHEFGHFHGGDVAIGPWIHKTRTALVRTVEELHDHTVLLALPFVAYAKLFFRLTHAVSRHQELLADRLAASVEGTRAVASGLRASDTTGPAFHAYWDEGVAPILAVGYLPPIVAGFDAFLKTPWVQEKIAEPGQGRDDRSSAGAHDTHPPLSERLSALGVDAASTEREPGPAALSLLDDLATLERRLVDIAWRGTESSHQHEGLLLGVRAERRALTPLGWDEVGTKVLLPAWQRLCDEHRKVFEGVTPASLPDADWLGIGRKIRDRSDVAHDEEVKDSRAADADQHGEESDLLDLADAAVGSALVVVLTRVGFRVESHPASPPVLIGPEDRIEVFGLRESFTRSRAAVDDWREFCARVGIADLDLAAACDRGAVRPPRRRRR